MHHDIILTLAGGLCAALVLGYLVQRIGISPIVGYLAAGIAVGPHTPGFVANASVAEQFAEIGIILLMFGVGLRFHIHELMAVWKVAVPGAILQSVASTAMTAVALHLMGWPWSAATVVGMAISVASTVVLVRVLTDTKDLHTKTGHIAVGWVVVEDLLTIALLVALPLLAPAAAAPTPDASPAWSMLLAFLKLVACVVLVVVGGGRVLPWVLERIAFTRSSELFSLTILAMALGIAVASAYAFGVSMALGAFLAGLVVGRTHFAARAAGDALPMRDAFAVLFFVSVGMLFDPAHLLAEPWLILVVLLIVVVGKPLAAIAVVRLTGRPWSIALPVGAVLGQVGEFTFILGTSAKMLGLIDERAWHTLIAVAIVSIAINPVLYRLGRGWSAARRDRAVPLDEAAVAIDGHCIVVGHGPVGQHVVMALAAQGIPATVIEMNLATVQAVQAAGRPAVYGDAARLDTLRDAGIDSASALILSSDTAEPEEIVRLARERRPGLMVMARCSRLSQVPVLRAAGATVVLASEGELAVSFTEAILASVGADAAHRQVTRAAIAASLDEMAHGRPAEAATAKTDPAPAG